MALGESGTRAKRIDPALHARGWTEDLIRREETAGAVEIVAGRPRWRARGRVDYTLRVKVTPTSQPVAVALIEAKAEDLPPAHGLEQGKGSRPTTGGTSEPVYKYDMAQGIDDSYLAACEIIRRDIFLGDQPRSERETGVELADLVGKTLTDALTSEVLTLAEARAGYEATSFKDRLLLPDRVQLCAVTSSSASSQPAGQSRKRLSSAPETARAAHYWGRRTLCAKHRFLQVRPLAHLEGSEGTR